MESLTLSVFPLCDGWGICLVLVRSFSDLSFNERELISNVDKGYPGLYGKDSQFLLLSPVGYPFLSRL